MKEKNKTKENEKREKKINLSLRSRISLMVLAVLLCISLLSVGVYYLLIFLDVIRYGELSAFWIIAIVIGVSNAAGAVIASLICAHYTKPIDTVIEGINRLAEGDFDVSLSTDGDQQIIRDLKESVNKTARDLNGIEVMRNDFINIISHEYKTPVASINGYAHRLKGDNLTQKQIEYVNIIIDESKHLSSLTTNILLLTKYENMHIIPESENYMLDEQIRKCVIFLQQEWMGKNIDMQGSFDKVDYCGNEDMMNQVWINLIKNAIKFTPEGGSIYCSVKKDGSNAVVSVKDSGCGMNEETLSHIFDKFYQADSSRRCDGNGLGLSIAKSIVTLSGGTITAQSIPEKGTCFTVTLPCEKSD